MSGKVKEEQQEQLCRWRSSVPVPVAQQQETEHLLVVHDDAWLLRRETGGRTKHDSNFDRHSHESSSAYFTITLWQ